MSETEGSRLRTILQNAQLALLLEVSSTPKPGNVDRVSEYDDLRFEHFVTGAVGAMDGLKLAAEGGPTGAAFERAVEGMSQQSGGNTQFGALLLVTPLAVAASHGDLTRERASEVVTGTTVDDAVNFYTAFDHVGVAVDDPPEEITAPNVTLGSNAEPLLRERKMTLADVMAESAEVDGLAAEWTDGFPRTFETARRIESRDGPVTERAAAVFLELLAEEIDTFVVTQHDRETAVEVRDRAREALDGEVEISELAGEFIQREINPGTTADIIAGGLFVALERGLEV